MNHDVTLAQIAEEHRRRRFAMKVQQKIDRALESFIRQNMTAWKPTLAPAEREAQNKIVKDLIKKIRAGEMQDNADMVLLADESRAAWDAMRDRSEKNMAAAVKGLPIYSWIESIAGVGAGGLAIIIGEAGDLSRFHNVAALWNRLGYAPYDGQAGSTWKRGTPRKLSAEEWEDHPFKGERYAQCFMIAESLLKKQVTGKAKTESGKTEAAGPYGKIYCDRRAHTDITHPPAPEGVKEEWPDSRRHKDAMRFMMKAFLKDLLVEWQRILPYDKSKDVSLSTETDAIKALKPKMEVRPSASPGHEAAEHHMARAGLAAKPKTGAKAGLKSNSGVRPSSPAKKYLEPIPVVPGSPFQETDASKAVQSNSGVRPSEPGHSTTETQRNRAGLTPKAQRRKRSIPFAMAAE